MDKKYLDQYNDLSSGNISNKNIMIFSTEDNVLEILQSGVTTSTIARTEGLFCRGVTRKAYSTESILVDQNVQRSQFGLILNGDILTRMGVDYDSFGVYFKLFQGAYIYFRPQGTEPLYPISGNFALDNYKLWTTNCKRNYDKSNVFNLTNANGFRDEIYSGTSNVSKFEIRVRVIYQKDNGSFTTTDVRTFIATN